MYAFEEAYLGKEVLRVNQHSSLPQERLDTALQHSLQISGLGS